MRNPKHLAQIITDYAMAAPAEYMVDAPQCSDVYENGYDEGYLNAIYAPSGTQPVDAVVATYTQEQLDTAVADAVEAADLRASNAESSAAYAWAQRDGLLSELRSVQDAYGVVVLEYTEYRGICELHGVWLDVEVGQ